MEVECLGLTLDLDVQPEATTDVAELLLAGSVSLPVQPLRQAQINTPKLSVYSNIGSRAENLDKVSHSVTQVDYLLTDEWQLMAVYDGHGSSAVSNYLKCNLLPRLSSHPLFKADFSQAVEDTFHQLDSEIAKETQLNARHCGSTALVVMLTDSTVFIANLGDSRALLVSPTGDYLQANSQHNLLNETEREAVAERGGVILKRGKQYRLDGQINISRAFGDQRFKPCLSNTPQVAVLPREFFKYLVIATDGFWENTNNNQVAELLQQDSQNVVGLAKRIFSRCSPKPSDNATIVCFEMR